MCDTYYVELKQISEVSDARVLNYASNIFPQFMYIIIPVVCLINLLFKGKQTVKTTIYTNLII